MKIHETNPLCLPLLHKLKHRRIDYILYSLIKNNNNNDIFTKTRNKKSLPKFITRFIFI